MKRKLLIIISLCFFITGCRQLNPEETAYIKTLSQIPSSIIVNSSEEAAAWGRAQSFIARFSSMKLQLVNDYVIQTYNPLSSSIAYSYYVTKTKLGDQIQIDVQCYCPNIFAGNEAKINEKILAVYVKSGELPYPHMISR